MKEAMDNYANVLLLDPENKAAKEALLSISYSAPVNSASEMQLLVFEDLSRYCNNLKEKADYYRGLRDQLGQRLIAQAGVPKNELVQEMKSIQDEVAASFAALHKAAPKEQGKKSGPLAAYNTLLAEQKHEYTIALAFVKAQYERLRQIEANVQKTSLKSIASIQPILKEVSETVKPAYRNIYEKVYFLEEKVETLSGLLAAKDNQLKGLSNQIVDLSLELSERDVAENYQKDSAVSFSRNIMELESRLSLAEKLLQEKDVQIHELKESVRGTAKNNESLRSEMDKVASANQDKLVEVTGILQIYKAKLADTAGAIKNNAEQIGAMHDKLEMANAKVFEKDVVLEKINEDLKFVNEQLAQIHKTILMSAEEGVRVQNIQGIKDDLLVLQQKLVWIRGYLAKKVNESFYTDTSLNYPTIK